MSQDIDVDRLRVDMKYWNSVSPEGSTYYDIGTRNPWGMAIGYKHYFFNGDKEEWEYHYSSKLEELLGIGHRCINARIVKPLILNHNKNPQGGTMPKPHVEKWTIINGEDNIQYRVRPNPDLNIGFQGGAIIEVRDWSDDDHWKPVWIIMPDCLEVIGDALVEASWEAK